MEVTVTAGQLGEATADAVVTNLFQGVTQPGGATGAVDRAMGGAISRLIAAGDFAGKLNQVAVLYSVQGGSDGGSGGVKAPRVILVGLGKPDTPERALADRLYEELRALGLDVIYDDRTGGPGAKFADAELLGCPLRLTVGGRTL